MKTNQIFPGSETGLRLLKDKAGAVDNFGQFKAALIPASSGSLTGALQKLSAEMDELAGVAPSIEDNAGKPVVMAGQQPYVDYSLGVAAKVDVLREGQDTFAGYFGFSDYDYFGSDRGIGQIRLPNPQPKAGTPYLSIRLHSGSTSTKFKDMRFVPPPGEREITGSLNRLKEALLFALHCTGRQALRKTVMENLAALQSDLTYACKHAASVAAFNMIWSVRTYRRLGFKTPFFAIGNLLHRPEFTPAIAKLIQPVIRENGLFIESIHQVLKLCGGCDPGIRPKEAGYLPLFLTDRESGERLPLVLVCEGGDFAMTARERPDIRIPIGKADWADLAHVLDRLQGLWSPSVFLPLFLYRMGFAGMVSGKSSVKYAVVIGHVQEVLFGERHPPNFLCAGTPTPTGLLHDAVRLHGGGGVRPAEESAPTLIYRLLFETPDAIRREFETLWKGSE
ncbi:MAG: hypothetical protein JW943_01360 [Deltaproteobacteria bacterium]|nr:hypothetical protein [Deltaproteobacteria bacterium]